MGGITDRRYNYPEQRREHDFLWPDVHRDPARPPPVASHEEALVAIITIRHSAPGADQMRVACTPTRPVHGCWRRDVFSTREHHPHGRHFPRNCAQQILIVLTSKPVGSHDASLTSVRRPAGLDVSLIIRSALPDPRLSHPRLAQPSPDESKSSEEPAG